MRFRQSKREFIQYVSMYATFKLRFWLDQDLTISEGRGDKENKKLAEKMSTCTQATVEIKKCKKPFYLLGKFKKLIQNVVNYRNWNAQNC